MNKFTLITHLLLITIVTLSLSGCLATAAAVGVAGGAYYEKNKD